MKTSIKGHKRFGPFLGCRYIGVHPDAEVVAWLLYIGEPHDGGSLVGVLYNRLNSGPGGGNQWVTRVYGHDHLTNFTGDTWEVAVGELWAHLQQINASAA
jgi:hypothetical protein